MCSETVLVPIPDLLWESGEIANFDPTHPEFGIDEQGRRCLALDACIVPAVKALWSIGVVTIACCCGHSDGTNGVLTIRTVGAKQRLGTMLVRVEEYDALRAERDALSDQLQSVQATSAYDHGYQTGVLAAERHVIAARAEARQYRQRLEAERELNEAMRDEPVELTGQVIPRRYWQARINGISDVLAAAPTAAVTPPLAGAGEDVGGEPCC